MLWPSTGSDQQPDQLTGTLDGEKSGQGVDFENFKGLVFRV